MAAAPARRGIRAILAEGRALFTTVRAVLAEGWGFFIAGLSTAFPWVLAAELLQEMPLFNPPGSILTTDLAPYAQPDHLVRSLILGTLQALFYGVAVLKLAEKADSPWRQGLRATLSILVAYICYEVITGIGLLFTFAFFMLGLFIAGWQFGLVLCLIPLAPTAAASTALALFIFPTVLERRGPFAALGESSRLAKRSWVKVSLVISVPALGLLAAAGVTDLTSIRHSVAMGLDLWDRAQESGVSMEQMDSILAGMKAEPVNRYDVWQVAGTLLGAFAWWYTLAVCYAQYRDLKAGEEA
jgi:hypothetical protein